MNYDHSESHLDDEKTGENNKISWSSRLQWSPAKTLSSSLGYSEYRDELAERPSFLNRVYSWSLTTYPLPAASVSVGLTHNERFSDNEEIFRSDGISIYSKLRLYPDLTASLSSSFTISDTLQYDDSDNGFFVQDKGLSSRLDITARLYRSLTGFLTVNQSTSVNEVTGDSETTSMVYRLNYRPSDLLAMQASYSDFFGDDERSSALSGSIEVYLLRTYKSRLSLLATHVQSDSVSDNFRMIGSWDVSDFFTLTTSGTYNISDVSNYSFQVNLSMRL